MTEVAVQAKVGSVRTDKRINDATLEDDFRHYSKFHSREERMRRYFFNQIQQNGNLNLPLK